MTIDALICDGASATILGLASINGASVDFTIDLLDAGDPGRSDTYRLQLSNGYDSGTQYARCRERAGPFALSQPLKRFVIGRRRSRPNARGRDLDPGRRLAALVLGGVDHPDHAVDHLGGHSAADQLLAALVLLDVGLEDRVEQVVGRQGVGVLLVRASAPPTAGAR